MGIEVRGNNGGDFFRIDHIGDDEVFIEVGHCCVVCQRVEIPISLLTYVLSEIDFEAVQVDHDPDRMFNLRVRKFEDMDGYEEDSVI